METRAYSMLAGINKACNTNTLTHYGKSFKGGMKQYIIQAIKGVGEGGGVGEEQGA